MYKIFGIKNCNTVKKALDHLTKNKTPFEFIDFKKYTPSSEDIQRWAKTFGELPVNKQGLTYKKYKDQYEKLSAKEKTEFICKNSSMIKRPILEKNGSVLLFGYAEDQYSKIKG